MGASSSYKTEHYLTNDEVNSVINNQELQVIFNKYKDKEGYITIDNFNLLIHYILPNEISQRLFQIISTNQNQFKFDDFKYLIALFYTKNYTAKLNFLCDLIFIHKPRIEKREYIINVNKYFDLSSLLLKIFLDNKFLQQYANDNSNVERNDVILYIDSNYKKDINLFAMLEFRNNKLIHDNRNGCSCYKNKKATTKIFNNENKFIIINENNKSTSNLKNSNLLSNIINISSSVYIKIEKEFSSYENSNNGVFPIMLFENMLNDINIIPSVINAIGNYLRQKTQKSFFNFNTFKDLLKCVHNVNNKNEHECLFDIMSYPNNYVKKIDMFIFLKETNSSLSSELINKYFNDMNITTSLNKEIFDKGINLFLLQQDNFISSFENLQYLHYINFNVKPNNKNIESQCMNILFKNKSYDDYIKECVMKENEFYVVDYLFWEKWNEYISSPESSNRKKVQSKKSEHKNLKMNTSRISNRHGGMLEGLKFMSDYILMTSKMYSLFSLWYGNQQGPILKRSKIFIENKKETSPFETKKNETILSCSDDEEDQKVSTTFKSITYNTNQPYNVSTPLFSGIDTTTGNKFEIEIYPISLLFLTLEELIQKYKNLDDIKDFLRHQSSPQTSHSHYYLFSKQTQITSILNQLEYSLNKTFEQGKIRLWAYYQHNFEMISLKGTIESKGITNNAIFVLEIFENNQWPIDRLTRGEELKKINTNNNSSKNKEFNPMLVGLVNLGYTCYMNAILQTFLNNEDIIKIFLIDLNKTSNQLITSVSNVQCNYTINMEIVDFLANKMTKCSLLKELLNLIILKYKGESEALIPAKFKTICGKYNKEFNGNEQQDAHDFLEFLLDSLHEETNIKCQKTKIQTTITNNDDNNSNNNNNYSHLLAELHWSNNILNNASYIHSLYLGQLKSTLTCTQCHQSKISYETFTSLSLPIPEESKMFLTILLFRLPFTLKPYYESIMKTVYKTSKSKINFSKNIRSSLRKIKANALCGIYSANNTNDLDASFILSSTDDNDNKKEELTNLNTVYFNEQQQNNKESFDPNKNNNNNLYSNTLNVNIPIKIRIELNKKDKCEMIIKQIKQLIELELEQTNTYTTYLIVSNGKYIDEQLTIDKCFIGGQVACVYEMLNYKGIDKVFKYSSGKYEEQIDVNVDSLIRNNIEFMITNPIREIADNNNTVTLTNSSLIRESKVYEHKKSLNKKEYLTSDLMISRTDRNSYEIILPIIHTYRVTKRNNTNLFDINQFEYIHAFQDYILLPNNTKCFRYYDLYNIIWEKYEYFLDMPSQVKHSLWWKHVNHIRTLKKQYSTLSLTPMNIMNNNKTISGFSSNTNISKQNLSMDMNNCDNQVPSEIKMCSPFVIKIISKKTKRCAFCPWFKFCTGCVIGVTNTNNIILTCDMILCIEWCQTIYNTHIKMENIQRVFNHHSFKDNNSNTNDNNLDTIYSNTNTINTLSENISTSSEINLMDCVNLFMQKEELSDIYCEKCKKYTTFKKNYEIAKFPQYLIITLKRFKYTAYYKQKINSLIKFPLTNLDLNSHACQYLQYHSLYDLYASINHSGNLNGGHYYSVINHNNTWIKYNDMNTSKTTSLENNNVYILIYKMITEPKNKLYFNYKGLLESSFLIYKNIHYNEWDSLFNFEFNKEENEYKEQNGTCRFYYGEPVRVVGKGRGVLIDVFQDNDIYYAKVKLNANNKNDDIVETNLSDVVKETLKSDYASEIIKEKKQKVEKIVVKQNNNESTNCGECVIM